jgi:4-carboxymuconolactone decarboxylase
VPDVGGADGALSSEWDDAVRLLVGFPDSDTSGSRRRVLGRGVIIATHEEGLRRLVLHDEGCIQSMLGIHLRDNAPGLDPRTQALVRLGGLVAMGAAPLSYHWAAEAALDAGATAEDVVGTLIAVAPISGLARVISATPEIAMAIGYDLDQAFEALSDD